MTFTILCYLHQFLLLLDGNLVIKLFISLNTTKVFKACLIQHMNETFIPDLLSLTHSEFFSVYFCCFPVFFPTFLRLLSLAFPHSISHLSTSQFLFGHILVQHLTVLAGKSNTVRALSSAREN